MNREQMEAARSAMSAWLAYPDELGKTQTRIECAGTFERHGMRDEIVKYKKGRFGKVLWGVCGGYVGEGLEHCGHVFSEMEEYNPAGAEERAVEMVEWIRAYWMDQAGQHRRWRNEIELNALKMGMFSV